eukprot:PhM_4_TR16948/c0_g1_i1/m.18709
MSSYVPKNLSFASSQFSMPVTSSVAAASTTSSGGHHVVAVDYSLKAGVRRIPVWYQALLVVLSITVVTYRDSFERASSLFATIIRSAVRPFDLVWLRRAMVEPGTPALTSTASSLEVTLLVACLLPILYLLLRTRVRAEHRDITCFGSSASTSERVYLIICFAHVVSLHRTLPVDDTIVETDNFTSSLFSRIVFVVSHRFLMLVVCPVAVVAAYRAVRDVPRQHVAHPRWYLFQATLAHGILFAATHCYSDENEREAPVEESAIDMQCWGKYSTVSYSLPIVLWATLNYMFGLKHRASVQAARSSGHALLCVMHRSLIILVPHLMSMTLLWLIVCILYVLPSIVLTLYLVFFFVWAPAALISFNTDFLMSVGAIVTVAMYSQDPSAGLFIPIVSGVVTLAWGIISAYIVQLVRYLTKNPAVRAIGGGVIVGVLSIAVGHTAYYRHDHTTLYLPPLLFEALTDANTFRNVYRYTSSFLSLHTVSLKLSILYFDAPFIIVFGGLHYLCRCVLRVPHIEPLSELQLRVLVSFATVFFLGVCFMLAVRVPEMVSSRIIFIPSTIRSTATVALGLMAVGWLKEKEDVLYRFVKKVCGFS